MSSRADGSVVWGGVWMVVIPVFLFWLPGIGGLIGGLVGGKVAGGVGSALLAWVVSSILVASLFLALGTLLTANIAIGAIAGASAFILALVDSGARLIGAIIGGLIA